jgi:hypothetical protein
MSTIPVLEDCQSYSLDNLTDLVSCAARLDVTVYSDYTDLPVPITRDVLPENVKTLLTECDGNDSCKLVAYDFQRDTGQKAASAEYVTTLQDTDALNRGVFIKNGSTPPVITIEPPGYSFSVVPINPSQGLITSPVPTTEDQKSSEMCARFCDTLPSCKAFNYAPLNSTCQFFSTYSFSYGGETSFTYVSYVKDDISVTAGKKQPNLSYGKTWLENTGSECTSMPACNSNLTALVNTGTSVGFSTDDLLACSYCPVRTFQFKDNAYFVQDEIGETKSFTDKNQAIQELLYTDIPNPNNTIKKTDGTRGTRNFMMYNIQPYETQPGFKPDDYLFVSDGNSTEYSIYRVSLPVPKYTCSDGDYGEFETMQGTINGVTKEYNTRDWFDNVLFRKTDNPGWFNNKGGTTRFWSTYSDSKFYTQTPPVGESVTESDGFHRLIGNMCYETARERTDLVCQYQCRSSGYTGASFSENTLQNCGDQFSKICSKPATVVPITKPIVFHSLTSSLLPVRESSNTFMVESVDYVTDGFRLRNFQTQKYVAGNSLIPWTEKYSPEFNSSIFILANPRNLLDTLKTAYPNSNFLLQSANGTRYTYDRTTVKVLQNVFSLFPLTFDPVCALGGINHAIPLFTARTLCTPGGQTPPLGSSTLYDVSLQGRCQFENTKWLVIDVPNGFEPFQVEPDTTNVATVPTNFATLYQLSGITNALLFPSASFTDDSRTSDGQSLRQWIQSQIYKPFLTPSLFYIPSFLSEMENNALYSNFYLQHVTCIQTKLDEVVTRLGNILTSVSVNINSAALYANFNTSLSHFNHFFTTTDPWSDVTPIINSYTASNNSKKIIVKNFITFLNQIISLYKTTIINEIMNQTNKYVVEAYGINDDDLNAISSTGSAGRQQGPAGIIALYQAIRQNKTDMDNLFFSDRLTREIDYIMTDTLPPMTDYSTANGASVALNPDDIENSIIINDIQNVDTDILPTIITAVDTLYTKYEDSYQKLQQIKGVAGPGDVPRIEDSLVQSALKKHQVSLHETVLYTMPMPGPRPDIYNDRQVQQGFANAVEQLTYDYGTSGLSRAEVVAPDFQKVIEQLTYDYGTSGLSRAEVVSPDFQKIIEQLTYNYDQFVSSSTDVTAPDFKKVIDQLEFGYSKPYSAIPGSWTCDSTTSKYYRTDAITQDAEPPFTRPGNPFYTISGTSYSASASAVYTPSSGPATRVTYTTVSGGLCACSTGYYDSVNDRCATCKTCAPTEYETTACTSSTNRECAACSTLTCPVITNATVQRTGCGSGSAGTCTYTCASGYYKSAGTDQNPTCTPCVTCSASTYETTACTSSTNRVCTDCASTCAAGTYESQACTSKTNRVCAQCATTCPYLIGGVASGCSTTTNATCSCPINTISTSVYDPYTQTSTQKCLCNTGYSSSTGYGSSCAMCSVGTYQDRTGQTSCKSCAACPSGQTRVCGFTTAGSCVNLYENATGGTCVSSFTEQTGTPCGRSASSGVINTFTWSGVWVVGSGCNYTKKSVRSSPLYSRYGYTCNSTTTTASNTYRNDKVTGLTCPRYYIRNSTGINCVYNTGGILVA